MRLAAKIGIPTAIVLAGFGLMILLLSLREDAPKRTPEPKPRNVAARVVSLGPVEARIVAFGRVISAQPVQLISEVTGTIEEGELAFRPGLLFARGDTLVRIDDRQASYRLNSTKADLLTALARVLPEIKVDFPREYQVWRDYFDAVRFDRTLPELPQAVDDKIRLFLARHGVYKLYFAVREQEITLSKHYFTAPFDGSILSTALSPGATARSGSALGLIVNLERLEVDIPVPTTDIEWIDRSRTVKLTSSEIPGEWSGSISRAGSAIDAQTQTAHVYVDLPGREAALLEGSFLRADLPGVAIDRAIRVPRQAVYDDEYVYLVVDGRFEYRAVRIARRETESVIVTAGLKPGDTLVTELLQGVAPGMPAIPRFQQAEVERSS